MDLPRIELGALRLLSACDTTTPQTHLIHSSFGLNYSFKNRNSIIIKSKVKIKKRKNYGFAED